MNALSGFIDFQGRPRPTAALHCYLIQAVAFGLAIYLFSSWNLSSIAFIPDEAFSRLSRAKLHSYWKTPWFHYTTFQFIYDFVPRPSATTIRNLQFVIIGSAFFGLLGIFPRIMAWVAFILGAHLIGGFLQASDTIDASTTVIQFLLLVVAIFPRDAYYTIRRFRPLELNDKYHGPYFLILFFMMMYYCLSAINKIVDIGPDWFLQARLDLFSVHAIERSLFVSTISTSMWFSSILSNYELATVSAFLVLVIELMAPLALFVPRLIPLFVLYFASMHFSIYLSHGYGYWSNMCVDLLLLPYTSIALWYARRQNLRPLAEFELAAKP
ncbi:hypothetical protein [Hyphomicrobium sp.]|uniref:hypothetical protein n=1 Tax=Hyphomicrobium sp. TaxID=82 RepID=UPI002E30AD5C|nr:hypothetical protein [Hyphomicrobium sp.]HEX2842736.1 hypothetical protein [Hyphomicrobium sp.]